LELTEVSRECWFLDVADVTMLPNRKKRNIMYWWYATNVYSIRGCGHRGELPLCLVQAIRAAYPEADGNYRGHRRAAHRSS
jgi:hypothetical protein